MRVLFVCSGNRGVSPIITAQAESLRKKQLFVEIVPIIGKGILGYLSNIGKLKREIKKADTDLVHAHYSFCGIVAALATGKPVVTSLMGSDIIHSGLWRWLILFFVERIWSATIVKSEDMKQRLGSEKVLIIPNGVDTERFKPLPRSECRERLGWSSTQKIVLFAADPTRMEKNYDLALSTFRHLDMQDSELKVVYNVKHEEMPIYINAANVVILTSLWEGSPNIIKEAMACNIPIVSTDVGDVRWLLDGVKGCFVASNNAEELSSILKQAVQFDQYTDGVQKLVNLGLISDVVAIGIKHVYAALFN